MVLCSALHVLLLALTVPTLLSAPAALLVTTITTILAVQVVPQAIILTILPMFARPVSVPAKLAAVKQAAFLAPKGFGTGLSAHKAASLASLLTQITTFAQTAIRLV